MSNETIYFAYEGTNETSGIVTRIDMVVDHEVTETLTDLVEVFKDFAIRVGYSWDQVDEIKYDHEAVVAKIFGEKK